MAGPGLIDRPLLVAAIDCLGLAPGAEPIPVGLACPVGPACRAGLSENLTDPPPRVRDQIAYQQLAVAATLDSGGLRLRGISAAGGPGSILSDGRLALLSESPRPLHPVSALVQMLVPSSVVQVPASRQTDWLLHHLPVPEAVVSPDSIPTAHLHLRDTWR